MKKIFLLFLFLLIIPVITYPQKKSKRDIIIESQISKDQLKIMNTNELLEKCLLYPYISDVMFAENIPLMFKYIREEFNGFNELFSRQDAAQVILTSFLDFDFEKINEYKADYEKGLYVFKFCYINLLLAQDEIIDALNDNYKIIDLINEKYSETDNENLIPFRNLVTVTFVGYNMLKYFENTELGKSSEILPFISAAQSIHITSLDFTEFDKLSEFVVTKVQRR